MVEAFKYLNYDQLAKNSLTSNRFLNLIRTHRNSLALLYVDYMGMLDSNSSLIHIDPVAIEIFDQKLSPEAYNAWAMRNSYSKQAPLQDEVATTQCTQIVPNSYTLIAATFYRDPYCSSRKWVSRTSALIAKVELNDENWPAFQHFIRLFTDPFIYIYTVDLQYQNAFLNALSGAVNQDRRIQCRFFNFYFKGNSQKSITWTKNHVHCYTFSIGLYCLGADFLDDTLLDFFLTGAHCTSKFKVGVYDMSKTIMDYVQKFMDIKNCDEIHLVEAISGYLTVLNRDYAEFIVKEEEETVQVFEFINNDIGKKLQLTVTNPDKLYLSGISIKINNL